MAPWGPVGPIGPVGPVIPIRFDAIVVIILDRVELRISIFKLWVPDDITAYTTTCILLDNDASVFTGTYKACWYTPCVVVITVPFADDPAARFCKTVVPSAATSLISI